MDIAFMMLVWLLALEIMVYNATQTANVWVESEFAGGLRWLWTRACAWVTALGFTWCILMTICFMLLPFNVLTVIELAEYSGRSFWLVALGALVRMYYYVVGDAWAVSFRNRLAALDSVYARSFIKAYRHYHGITTFKGGLKAAYNNLFAEKQWAWRLSMVLLTIGTIGVAPLMVALLARYAATTPMNTPMIADATTTTDD